MEQYIGTVTGPIPVTYEVPTDQTPDTLYWMDSPTRWHLAPPSAINVAAVCGTRFDLPDYVIPRDANPTVHANRPLCKRCAAINSKDSPA